MSVPLLDLQAQYKPIREDIMRAVARVCDSQRFILGPETESLERELAALIEVKHAVAVSSGTDALLLAMMALGIGAGDEVITSTYSFFATAGCITRLGAKPVLVDIDPETFNMDVTGVRAALSSRTRAIIPVHLFGQCADMDPLLSLATEAGVAVIEDACQAIGSTYGGRQAGSMGVAGCFSFFPSKNLGAFGDAGLVTTQDDDVAKSVRLLRGHGAERRYYHERIGGNFRMDELQAAVLRVKAPHLADWTAARQANAARYRRLFAEHEVTQVRLPSERADRSHGYNQFVIRAEARDALKAHLQSNGIGCEVYYPVPFHRQACFAGLASDDSVFPHANDAAATTLALPIYGELTESQQVEVVRAISDFYGASK